MRVMRVPVPWAGGAIPVSMRATAPVLRVVAPRRFAPMRYPGR